LNTFSTNSTPPVDSGNYVVTDAQGHITAWKLSFHNTVAGLNPTLMPRIDTTYPLAWMYQRGDDSSSFYDTPKPGFAGNHESPGTWASRHGPPTVVGDFDGDGKTQPLS
jgi:hypothetical protein